MLAEVCEHRANLLWKYKCCRQLDKSREKFEIVRFVSVFTRISQYVKKRLLQGDSIALHCGLFRKRFLKHRRHKRNVPASGSLKVALKQGSSSWKVIVAHEDFSKSES